MIIFKLLLGISVHKYYFLLKYLKTYVTSVWQQQPEEPRSRHFLREEEGKVPLDMFFL